LKQEEIPLAGRIFAVADGYDGLKSEWPYRTSWAESQAGQYLHDHAGSIFDPQIVDEFLQMMEKQADEF